MQQHKRHCPEEMGLRAEHSVAPGLLFRNHRENILGYSSVLSHCIFCSDRKHWSSFLSLLPALALFKKCNWVNGKNNRDTGYERLLWSPVNICCCFADEEKNRPTSAAPVSVQCASSEFYGCDSRLQCHCHEPLQPQSQWTLCISIPPPLIFPPLLPFPGC